jgi:hypothetical protein
MSDDQSSGAAEQTFIELEAGSEWRFELEADENIAVRVSPGFAVVFPPAL